MGRHQSMHAHTAEGEKAHCFFAAKTTRDSDDLRGYMKCLDPIRLADFVGSLEKDLDYDFFICNTKLSI